MYGKTGGQDTDSGFNAEAARCRESGRQEWHVRRGVVRGEEEEEEGRVKAEKTAARG